MAYALNQFLRTADQIDTAAHFVERMLKAEEDTAGTKDAAHRTLARRHKVSPSLVRDLCQPSRRPKSISFRCWLRLWDGYISFLQKQLVAIRAEIRMVEALGPNDAAVADLLDQTRALVREIEALTGTADIHPKTEGD